MKPTDTPSSMHRRAFMGTSVAGTAATLLSAVPAVHGQETGKLKLALVGCGGRGTGAASQNMKTGATKLVAMAEAFDDRLESSYERLFQNHAADMDVPPERRFVGFDAYKKAIDAADVVILTTPPGFRPLHFEYAIQQGKHVFMEKPVASDAAGIRRVLVAAKIADQKGLKVAVGLQRRYQGKYLRTLEKLRDGVAGDIVSGRVQWNGGGVWVRKRAEFEAKAGRKLTEMEYQMRNWYYFNWLCGDHIAEQHIHNIDVANWFLGEFPLFAEGMGGREVRKGEDFGQIFDHHYVAFTYPSGRVIHSQCRHIRGCSNGVWENFHCSKGKMNIGRLTSMDGKDVLWADRGRGDANPYQVEHDELMAAIQKNTPQNDAVYGAMSTMSSILGRMATYSGKKVVMDEALEKGQTMVPPEAADWSWDTMPPCVPNADGTYPVPVPGVYNPLV